MLITARANPRVKAIRALRDRKERTATGVFYVEGALMLGEAFRAGAVVELVVFAPERAGTAEQALLSQATVRDCPLLEVSEAVLDSLSFREDPQTMGAVVRMRHDVLPEAAACERCWTGVHEVQHPGNLGTLIRNSDASGGAGVVLTGDSTDPYHPVSVRGSLGAIFSQRVVQATPEALEAWLRSYPSMIVGASPTGSTDYRHVTYKAPVVLLMGGERAGLSTEQRALCQEVVRIPMEGVVDSLNLTVAAALLQYEVARQLGQSASA